eukprot:gnl/TRDRNA2_/TRDRNA2_70459_c1_seq1.p2 gnl/TRDRNA2_/TRDRNA2_70459_c1~~gnl/TRDRNA2_/TRDRNA2_70459_c1_seq1.p2  ORF type:complete len:101 (-),score=11.80 gnl/TRDRNA2_/TRDRNA2_70459_c1_seq1:9-311(-)
MPSLPHLSNYPSNVSRIFDPRVWPSLKLQTELFEHGANVTVMDVTSRDAKGSSATLSHIHETTPVLLQIDLLLPALWQEKFVHVPRPVGAYHKSAAAGEK